MSKFTELMLKYSDGELELKEAFQFEKTLLENQDLKREYQLNQRLDEYMRVQNMMQQIQNDHELDAVTSITKDIVKNKPHTPEKDQGIDFFINGAILQNSELEKLVDEAEREIYSSGIGNQTMEWVKQWEEQKNNSGQPDKYTLELFDFVRSGMNEGSKQKIRTIVNKDGKTKKLLVYFSSAAAILALAFGLTVIFNSKTNPNELFTEYYQPYKIIDGQTRSSKQQINDKFKEAVKLYENSNFSKAEVLFNELLKTDTSTMKIQLLFGICQLEEQHYESAKLNFQGIINKNGEYLIEAKWYLAMTYLKKQDIKSAQLVLNELAGTPGYYKEKSEELLKKL